MGYRSVYLGVGTTWFALLLTAAPIARAASPVSPAASPNVVCCGSGSVWSGSDTNTTVNAQGNYPQSYVGEVGTYIYDFAGGGKPCPATPTGGCFSTTAAADANYRAEVEDTGEGTYAYYFVGGPGVEPGLSPMTWGEDQGSKAVADAGSYSSYILHHAMCMDIEPSSAGEYGWTGNAENDRLVFNGFFDEVEAHGWTPCVYSAGSFDGYTEAWQVAMGTGSYASIPNTVTWTYEGHNWTGWPSTGFDGNSNAAYNAQWFGSSNYQWMWQFGYSAGGDDWDMFYTGNDP